ncbi:MAG: CBS domain-containing protein [Rubritepida sp.]|jgi:CBS domain-containing protein|nr:CBS domain-containing protein [Rubritepida sp.]MCU0945199.1 CBS domain-containing protein [Rubritepida sp.]
MLVKDVMSRAVLTVAPETPVSALAAMLSEQHVSGAPVVDTEGALLGMVTERDLSHRLAARVAQPPSWLKALFSAAPQEALDYAKARGRTARDIMTTPVITVGEEATCEEAARLLEAHAVRRLPVLRDGRLVGLVSRADLLRALLTPEAPASGTADDASLREAIRAALREAAWSHAYSVHFIVRNGEVTFYGFPAPTEVQRGLRVLAEGVPGVKAVSFPG